MITGLIPNTWPSFDIPAFMETLMTIFNKILLLVQDVFNNINDIFAYAFTAITNLATTLNNNNGVFRLLSDVYNTVPDIYRNLFIFAFAVSVIFIMARKMG